MEMQRQQRDRECLRDASRLLYGSLTGKGSAGYRTRDCGSVWREMEKILLYFRMEMPEPVEGMEEVQAVLDVVQAETGLLMRKIALTGEWWKEASMPLLAFDREGKALALLPGGSHRYCRAVQGGRDRLAGKDAEEFQTIAYCFYKPLPREETGMGAFGKFLLQSLSAADVLAVFGISLLLELAGLILPYISRIVYDTVIPSGTAKELPGILVLVVSSILFSALIGLARNVWVARIGNKMAAAAQSAVWDRMFHLPVRFFRDYDSGELFGRADAVNQVCALLGGEMIPTALTALLSVIYLFQISAFARELVMPSVFIILLLTLNTGCMCFFQVRRKQEENRAGNAVTGMVCQLLGGDGENPYGGRRSQGFWTLGGGLPGKAGSSRTLSSDCRSDRNGGFCGRKHLPVHKGVSKRYSCVHVYRFPGGVFFLCVRGHGAGGSGQAGGEPEARLRNASPDSYGNAGKSGREGAGQRACRRN